MSDSLYFEDFPPGTCFTTPDYTISKQEAIDFARQFDPQFIHIDEEAAKQGVAKRLIVSGWHTAAICMRLKAGTDLTRVAGGLLGLGIDKLRWPQPVYPEDTIHLVITVIDARPSASKPTHGVLRYTMEAFNQHQQCVYSNETSVWMPRKSQ